MSAIIELSNRVTPFDLCGMKVYGVSVIALAVVDMPVEERFFEVCYGEMWHGCHSGKDLIAAGASKTELEASVEACASSVKNF